MEATFFKFAFFVLMALAILGLPDHGDCRYRVLAKNRMPLAQGARENRQAGTRMNSSR